MFCAICKSTEAVGAALCPYCFAEAKPRRRRNKGDEKILAALFEALRGIVGPPDVEAMWWALVSKLAERGTVDVLPSKKVKGSKSR
jgi:hypothetical protein